MVATFPEDSHKKVEYPVAVVEGHNNATVKAFYDYLKGRRLRKSLNVTDLQQVMILTDPEWQAVLLSLKVSSGCAV